MSVTLTDGTNLDDLLDNYPGITTFYFESGTYYITKVLHIQVPNIKLIGLTNASMTHIVQTNTDMDGISFKFADYCEMRNISVHVEHDNKVALTVASCNYNKIEDNYFYGNTNCFCVYFAGPSNLVAGQDTLDAYNNNILDSNNVFRRNVVYSKWSGDNVSFSLQYMGLFTYNIIRGGKAAIYMCKNSWVTCNRIHDCTNHGIFLSLPSHNTHIKYNTILECPDSAIVVKNQVEHGLFEKTPYSILIKGNYLYDAKNNSIECNDLSTSTIDYNTFVSTDMYGLYCLRCDHLDIINNKISYFNVAAWLEQTSNCNIANNTMLSIFPTYGNNIAKITNESNDNIFTTNIISGKIIYDLLPISEDSINNIITNNTVNPYYTYAEELLTMKKLP